MAVLFPPDGGEPHQISPRNGRTFALDELQGLVGGYIEGLRTRDGWMFINEDGKRLRLAYNELATEVMRGLIADDDYIVGVAIICTPLEAGATDEDDEAST